MTRRTQSQRVADMIAAGGRAISHVGGLDAARLAADQLRADAVVRALEVMGEACKHVAPSVRDRFPAVPWRLITGMRDRLIHGYDDVDWQIVADTVARFIPGALDELRAVHAALLAEEPPPPEVPADA